jgi:hypothetical protein
LVNIDTLGVSGASANYDFVLQNSNNQFGMPIETIDWKPVAAIKKLMRLRTAPCGGAVTYRGIFTRRLRTQPLLDFS